MEILVVEDERKLANALKEGLEADQYSVSVAHTGEEGFFLLCKQRFDLAILDVMLPGRDGFEVLGTLRQQGIRTPVLLLTARDSIEDRVRGLDEGADDYLIKPFAFPELLARVRALLRRGRPDQNSTSTIADLEVDSGKRSVKRSGERIELTTREFELLVYLFQHKGHVVSREMIARDLWKEPGRETPLDNVIDVHIARLRRKIDDPFNQKLLHTVRGVGFVLRDTEP